MLFSSSHEIEDKSNSTYSLSKLRLLSFCVLTITALYAFGSITNYLLFFTDILKPQDHSNFSEYYNQKLKLVSYIKSPTLLLYLLITYILNKDLGVFSTIAFALIIIAAIINSIFSLIPAGHYQKAFYVIYGITTVVIYSRIGAASEEDTSITRIGRILVKYIIPCSLLINIVLSHVYGQNHTNEIGPTFYRFLQLLNGVFFSILIGYLLLIVSNSLLDKFTVENSVPLNTKETT